jgi:repressor LexA
MENDAKMKNRIRSILVECRLEHNLTQTEVGRIVGKSKNAVASWEQGLSMPDVITLLRLARFYNKDIDYMYGLKGDE